MGLVIFSEGNRYPEVAFDTENEFEEIIKENSKLLFGQHSIYLDFKNKIESKSLGNAIPDGILFDLRDKENPEFYLVEAELSKHDFYDHIFPQITKFFAFFNNPSSQNKLIDTLFRFVTANSVLEEEFKEYLGKKEIYKWLKDLIENSQNILLIIDDNKDEFREIFETYKETWGKMVKIEILKEFNAASRRILTLDPDFETVGLVETVGISDKPQEIYTEQYHLEDVVQIVQSAYGEIKNYASKLDPNIKTNPQRYYISLRENKNFAYIYLKKKKMWITIMLPFENGVKVVKKHKISDESEGVKKFYGGPCFSILIENMENIEEIFEIIKEAYERQNK